MDEDVTSVEPECPWSRAVNRVIYAFASDYTPILSFFIGLISSLEMAISTCFAIWGGLSWFWPAIGGWGLFLAVAGFVAFNVCDGWTGGGWCD